MRLSQSRIIIRTNPSLAGAARVPYYVISVIVCSHANSGIP